MSMYILIIHESNQRISFYFKKKNIEGAQKSQPLMFFFTYSSSNTTQLYYKHEI